MRLQRSIYALFATLLGGAVLYGFGAEWQPERELLIVRGTGWVALSALLLAIVTTPLARVLEHLLKQSVAGEATSLRRAFGVSSAALAALHATAAITTYLRGEIGDLLELTWLRAGVLAFGILLPLWLTSFPRIVSALRVKLWKPVHRLAYLAVLLAFQHTVLSPFAHRGLVLTVFGLTAFVWLLRLMPRRRARPASPGARGESG